MQSVLNLIPASTPIAEGITNPSTFSYMAFIIASQYYSTLLYFNLKTSVDAHLQDTVHSQTVHSLSIYMYAHERESKQS